MVSERHFLKFTARHVHVAPKNRSSWFGSTKDLVDSQDASADTYDKLGYGYLGLLTLQKSLICDGDHVVFISNELNVEYKDKIVPQKLSDKVASSGRRISTGAPDPMLNVVPAVRVTTRSLSSFISVCPKVQHFLLNLPAPLGVLPSSKMMTSGTEIAQTSAPSDEVLMQAMRGLSVAEMTEVCHFFLVLMRGLVRALTGGTGAYDEANSDPYDLSPRRIQAFVMILMLFGSVAPEVRDLEDDDALMSAYVDLLFDEEVPIPLSFGNMKGQSTCENVHM